MHEEQRQILQEQLIDVILHVLRTHPELHYYQGYHDIAVTLLLVSGERMAMAMLERLSTLHLRYGARGLLWESGGLEASPAPTWAMRVAWAGLWEEGKSGGTSCTTCAWPGFLRRLVFSLCHCHSRDFMDPTMDSTKHILNYLMPILQRESPRLHDYMQRCAHASR